MNRPTPISVFSDQRRTKSTTWSRTSCGTQLPVRVPQEFFLERRAPPSAQPGLRPWSAPSSPRTQSVSASPPPGGGDAAEPERQLLRSRRTLFASGRTPSASGSVLHTDPKLAPCPKGAASKPQPFLQQCSAYALSSYVRSIILTEERFLHFQLRQDSRRSQLFRYRTLKRRYSSRRWRESLRRPIEKFAPFVIVLPRIVPPRTSARRQQSSWISDSS